MDGWMESKVTKEMSVRSVGVCIFCKFMFVLTVSVDKDVGVQSIYNSFCVHMFYVRVCADLFASARASVLVCMMALP